MAILVTGAAGFIGSHVASALLRRGERVVGLDNLNAYYDPALKEARLAHVAGQGGDWRFARADLAEADALAAALAGEAIDRIVHLGAQGGVRHSIDNPAAYVRSNLVGHANMLELARARQVRHMVYASSSSVYGAGAAPPFAVGQRTDRPRSLYAATKKADEVMSEAYAHLFRVPLTGLRFFTVYGPWGRPDMAPWLFTEAILAGRPIRLFNEGAMERDFTYVDDIVAGTLAALDRPPAGDGRKQPGGSTDPHALYNLGNSTPVALGRFVSVLEEACGRRAERDLRPMQPGDVPSTAADVSEAARDLGFRPAIGIEEGLPRFVAWFRRYHA